MLKSYDGQKMGCANYSISNMYYLSIFVPILFLHKLNLYESYSVKRGLNALAKTFGSRQPAQSAPADMNLIFRLPLFFMSKDRSAL